MECSWLRSQKATTLSYEKKDYDRIFSHNGTGFSRAGTYGTNALYTWHTQTTDAAATQATMRFYLTYRPLLNETKVQLAESDVLVVNFGLHYLLDKRDEFTVEMNALLELMKPFAATKGRWDGWVGGCTGLFSLFSCWTAVHCVIHPPIHLPTQTHHHNRQALGLAGDECPAPLQRRRVSPPLSLPPQSPKPTNHPQTTHPPTPSEFPLTIAPERFGVPRKDYEATMATCFDIHFGPYVHPQWRDKLFLFLAREMGYEVKFLGSYDHLVDDEEEGEEEGEEEKVSEGGLLGRDSTARRPRRRRGVDLSAPCGGEKQKKKASAVGPDGSIVSAAEGEEEEEGVNRKPILYWMPFYRITSERKDLHPYNEWKKKYDCTHYCYTPFLWDPLVDGLAATMDAAALQEQEEAAAAEACADAVPAGGSGGDGEE